MVRSRSHLAFEKRLHECPEGGSNSPRSVVFAPHNFHTTPSNSRRISVRCFWESCNTTSTIYSADRWLQSDSPQEWWSPVAAVLRAARQPYPNHTASRMSAEGGAAAVDVAAR